MDTPSLGAYWLRSNDDETKWTRKLIAGEYFCYKAAAHSSEVLKREVVSLVTHVQVRVEAWSKTEFVNSIRDAWLRTRYDYPDIATTAEVNGIRTYRTGTSEVQSWLSSTFLVSNQSVQDLRFEAAPRLFAMLYWLPTSSELVLCSSHWRIDGMGSVLLLRHILDQLVLPLPVSISDFGHEQTRLTPDLFCAFPKSNDRHSAKLISQQGEQRCKEISGIEVDKSFILPQINTGGNPSGHRQIRLQFNASESEEIINACRQQNMSVTAVVHTAYAIALLKHNHHSHGRYSSSARVQFRPFLQPPYDCPSTNAASMWTAVEAMSIFVNATEFISTAKSFSSFYRNLLSRIRGDGIGPSLNAMFIYLADDPNGLNVLMALPYLTSLGNVDTVLPSSYSAADGSAELSVTDFSFSSTQMGKGVGGFLWTFGGKLTLEVGFNAAYYAESTISSFLDQVRSTLIAELSSAVPT